MTFLSTALVLAAGIAGLMFLARYCWLRRTSPATSTFFWLVIALWVWCAGELALLLLAASGLPVAALARASVVVSKLQWIGILASTPLWFVFARRYVGRPELGRAARGALWGVGLTGLVLVWTNEAHGLIWARHFEVPVSYGTQIRNVPGIAYYVLALCNWPLGVIGSFVVLGALRRRDGPFRRQSWALAAGAMLPLLANVAHVSRLRFLDGFDPTPIAFATTTAIFGWSLYRDRLIDLMPAARDAVIDSMSDALLVLDARGRVLDANPAARRLIGAGAAAMVGQPVEHVVAVLPELASALTGTSTSGSVEVVGVGPPGARRHLEVSSSVLSDRLAGEVGRLLLIRDVTERKRLNDALAAFAQRAEAELASAREIQLAMVPAVFPGPSPVCPADIHATLRPAREVGGDLYDVFMVGPGRLCIVVADVSGKGVAAALFMARVRTLVRAVVSPVSTQVREGPLKADRIVALIDEGLSRDNPSTMFVTMVLGLVDLYAGTFEWCNAGHPDPVVVDGRGEVVTLRSRRHRPLGVVTDAAHASCERALRPGDRLVLYTDGVVEAEDPGGRFFGFDGLRAQLVDDVGRSPSEVVERVLASVALFGAGVPQSDDIAIVVLRLRPELVPYHRASRVVDGDAAAMSEVAPWCDRFAAEASLEDGVRIDLQIALDELLANARDFARPGGPTPTVRVELLASRAQVTATLEYEGLAFDPSRSPRPPRRVGPASARPIGGLGLHFVNRLMSDVRYERDGLLNRIEASRTRDLPLTAMETHATD